MLFMMRCISRNCLRRRLTSWTWTPEPAAMRRRREPSMIAGFAPLPAGHGIDDGDLAADVPVALVGRHAALLGRGAGELVEQRAHAAHLLQLLELALEVDHVEALALDDLLGKALGLVPVDLRCTCSTRLTTSPMPRMREAMRSGSKGSRASVFSPDAHEHDGLAGDLAHRERGAAAGVAVGLGEHDAGEVEGGAEGARGIDRVLAGHGSRRRTGARPRARPRRRSAAPPAIRDSSTCSRPAVSTMSTSNHAVLARSKAWRAMSGRSNAIGGAADTPRPPARPGAPAAAWRPGGERRC